MDEKTCSITVTITDNKEIVLQCTPSYLKEVKVILNKIRPLMEANDTDGTIRIWKLGNLKNNVLPTPEGVNKLIEILKHNNGIGVLDIVWDDMIKLEVEHLPIRSKFIFLGDDMIIDMNTIKSIILFEA